MMSTSDNEDIIALCTGYGYQCAVVDYGDLANHSDAADHAIQVNLAATMKWAVIEIQKIQKAARSGKPIPKPRWPMIFLDTPKGWTGPRFVGGLPVETASELMSTVVLQKWCIRVIFCPKSSTTA